jgi:hypothetical protein
MYHPFNSAFLFSAVVLLGASGLHSASAQTAKIDTTHLSDDAFCIVRIDVQKLRGHMEKKSEVLEKFAALVENEGGFDLMEMKAVTTQNFFAIGESEPEFAVTFEFSQDFDRESFFEKNPRFKSDETEFMGKTYLKASSKSEPNLYFANKRKFTMATAGAIELIIQAESGMGTMADKIKSAPAKAEISVAFRSNDGFKEMASQFFSDLPPLGLPIDPLKSIHTVLAGTGYMDLRSSSPLVIQLTCKNKAAASQMKGLSSALVAMGKTSLSAAQTQLDEQMKNLENLDEEVQGMIKNQLSVAAKAMPIANEILAGFAAQSKENVVTMKVNRMGGMSEMVGIAIEQIFMGIGFSQEFRGPIEDPEFLDRPIELKGEID